MPTASLQSSAWFICALAAFAGDNFIDFLRYLRERGFEVDADEVDSQLLELEMYGGQ